MASHILCIGGEDHALRIPFLAALQHRGFRVTAAGTGDGAPFARAGIAYRGYRFDRFLRPSADWAAVAELTRVMHDIRPDLVQVLRSRIDALVVLVVSLVFFGIFHPIVWFTLSFCLVAGSERVPPTCSHDRS